MKHEVTKCIQQVVLQYTLPNLKGHSLHIGGTLHYLLLDIQFDVIKPISRWSGESSTKYLHKHGVILTLYLQECPDLVKQFTRYAMPPIC
jgi:hypothetical protein